MILEEIILNIQKRNFKKVIVTGSQRSGTTISAKIMAKELGYEFIDEHYFKVDNLLLFFKLLSEKENLVIQSPGLSYMCHRLPLDIFVVFMVRDFCDIEKSANRVKWTHSVYESGKYFSKNEKSWEVKKLIWDKWQKPSLTHRFAELEYENMKSHQLWIEKELRVEFKQKQTSF